MSDRLTIGRSQERTVATEPMPPRRARAPLGRVSTPDALVHVLTREILDGELPPGARLIEIDLAEAHGVSRQSLRSALAELVHLGLLKREPHRGVRVPRLSDDELRDLWYVRELIEGEAIRRGTSLHVDWSPLDVAARQIAALNEDSAWADAVEADLAFHRALVGVVASPHLTRAHELLMSEMRLSLAGNAAQEVPGYMAGEHREMVEVFRRGDAAASVRRLHEHLQAGLNVVAIPMLGGD
jgi:DNA-binding GntR family transcriptional regulator